jgi:hypothetical protein
MPWNIEILAFLNSLRPIMGFGRNLALLSQLRGVHTSLIVEVWLQSEKIQKTSPLSQLRWENPDAPECFVASWMDEPAQQRSLL